MKNLIIGTAGHIDHGKTRLVKAITGTDTDRLIEEKQRGITIDIGFAELKLSEYRIGFIDVPGHEKFVKNMLAGIGGIQLVMLVVAADESVMPQTIEHFQICQLLNIQNGLIVLTKCEQVDQEMIELVKEEVRDLVGGSFLEDAPICEVDSLSGKGIRELKKTLEALISGMEAKGQLRTEEDKLFRLSVDRVFSAKGFGTVVTGTAQSGELKKESLVAIHPAGKTAKVRGIQIFGESTDTAFAGQRTAINLSGVEKYDLYRGSVISTNGPLSSTQMIDAQIELLADAPTALRSRSPVRFHHGSSELIGRVYLLGERELPPGNKGLVQIRLESPTLCVPGDRFILRRYSPLTTVGGGVILDNSPVKHRRKDYPDLLPGLSLIQETLAKRGSLLNPEILRFFINQGGINGLDLGTLGAKTGIKSEVILNQIISVDDFVRTTREPPRFVLKNQLEASGSLLVDLLRSFLSEKPLSPGISKGEVKERLFKKSTSAHYQALLEWFSIQGIIAIREEFISLPGRDVSLDQEQEKIRTGILNKIAGLNHQPAALEDLRKLGSGELVRDIFFHLIRSGDLIKINEELVTTPSQMNDMIKALREEFPQDAEFSVPEFKDLFGFSRKYAIPVLEYLDRNRITRRTGDRRTLMPGKD